MIINKDTEKNAETLSSGMEGSMNMSIDASDQGVLQMILSEGLYSDPMGSTIREWASNALDATREAGNDEPIIVAVKYLNGAYVFSVQDFGVGMSPERVDKVISKYAASTKRGDANQLGFFGLGLKSGLAYADAFNIETIYDGIKYLYVMYKGEENTKIDLVNSAPTEDRNGSKLSLVIKREDLYTFQDKVREQLAYFSGVHFEVSGISNDFNIIESEDWKFSDIVDDDSMHIALDNVYYPLDFGRLKLNTINLNVALNFKVSDGIMPTPSRESIKLIPAVKELIINKYNKVCTYFAEKYIESVSEVPSFLDIMDKLGQQKTVEIGGHRFHVTEAAKAVKIDLPEPKVKGAPDLDLKKLSENRTSFLKPYDIVGLVRNNTYKGEASLPNDIIRYLNDFTVKFILIQEKPSKVLIDYIKESYYGKAVYFLRYNPAKEQKLGNKRSAIYYGAESTYFHLLDLKQVPKAKWRERIQQFQAIRAELVSRITKIQDVVPTKEWLEQRKANRKRTKAVLATKEEVRLKWGWHSNRSDFYASFLDNNIYEISNLRKLKHFTVYGRLEQKADLAILFMLSGMKNFKSFKVALVSERDYNKLNNHKIHNFMTIEDFLEGKHKTFGDFCSMLKIEQLAVRYKVGDLDKKSIEEFHSDFADQIDKVHTIRKLVSTLGSVASEETVTDMMKVCEENNLWDPIMEEFTKSFEENCKKFNFIHQIKSLDRYSYKKGVSIYSEDQKQIIKEILTARKVKMNASCYPAPVVPVAEIVSVESAEINEEPELVLSEEQVQELNTIIADEIAEQEIAEVIF